MASSARILVGRRLGSPHNLSPHGLVTKTAVRATPTAQPAIAESTLEERIVTLVRNRGGTLELQRVAAEIADPGIEHTEVRRAIRSLVDRGDLQVTLDWKLHAPK